MAAPRELAWVALGSNLGDRAGQLRSAIQKLSRLPETTLLAETRVEETAPLGGLDQPAYLNQMVLLRTGLSPRVLLEACLAIEEELGRLRSARWAPRTLDLDIVRFGERQIAEPGLTIPHPGLPDRDFWQRELDELAPYAS